ncbi:ABC transporter substrate-binding protein [Thermodesulfobacteriota bacterium]
MKNNETRWWGTAAPGHFFALYLPMVLLMAGLCCFGGTGEGLAAGAVKVGLNYPKTGPYADLGLDQLRGARLACDEINAAGGIMGRQVELVVMDSASKPARAVANVKEMIGQEKVTMVLGGASSSVAAAVSEVCYQRGVLNMITIAGAPALTGANAHRTTFRVCYNSTMDTRALAMFLTEHYADTKYFYITADCPMGRQLEQDLRKLTGTEDAAVHKSVQTPFPNVKQNDFARAMRVAEKERPDILLLVQFGKNVSTGIMQASIMGLKQQTQIVVPFLELTSTEGIPPKILEGVIGTTDWAWEVPYRYNYRKGIAFVESYDKAYKRYPSWGAASAYTILHEYKAAVERARTFRTPAVI